LAPRDKEDVVTCSTSSIHHVVDMFFNEAGNAIQHNIAVYTRSIKHKLYFRQVIAVLIGLDWIEQCFTSPPTQYRLYGRRFLQVKRPKPTVSKY